MFYSIVYERTCMYRNFPQAYLFVESVLDHRIEASHFERVQSMSWWLQFVPLEKGSLLELEVPTWNVTYPYVIFVVSDEESGERSN